MKPRDIFKIIVATAGWVLFCIGVYLVIVGVVTTIAFSEMGHLRGYLVLQGAMLVAIGLFIMKGHTIFVNIAFPPEAAQKSDESADGSKDI